MPKPIAPTLPRAPWTSREALSQLTAALGAENMRWVGGAVRDTLLDIEVNDIDCATTHRPETVIDLCAKAGIRTVPTGIDHGTLTAVFDDCTIEVTTLRRDVATDGRRATIAYAQEWKEDAARRDFTINALYVHPETLEISDYFGGLKDLAAQRVRFIGSARDRIAEDHLRILRYYRFQARFGAELDEEAEEACADMAETMKGLSRERVSDELLRLLTLPDCHPTIARMHERGVLKVILPETCNAFIADLAGLMAEEEQQGFAPDPVRRLAALLPTSPDIAETVSARLRFSKAQRAQLVSAVSRDDDDQVNPRALAYTITPPFAIDRLLLLGADAKLLSDWQPPTFPLKGGEIVARGVDKGPDVAKTLQKVERRWVEEGFPGKDRVDAMLEEELGK
ncbi:CCA tRNA nucleotidyltransferase [Erythrobacter sp. YT30]|uniref:CCA tRNA nucleotidyltransferase n=1 Tax=Erythrobacter sp. YT30 TaxID=1735012 RepID=UPI00076C69F2|nr:CCA tRNA nucleotidyltransferase [Erythrobacter sp. YT30]KWV90487.1 polynucleotide adenylyltransferase [Erythrobacter sp. YT30]